MVAKTENTITVPVILDFSPEMGKGVCRVHHAVCSGKISDTETKVELGSVKGCIGGGVTISIETEKGSYDYFLEPLVLWQAVKTLFDQTVGLPKTESSGTI